jgi:hypothetical protein
MRTKTVISTRALSAATRRRLWRNYQLEAYLHGVDGHTFAMSGDMAKSNAAYLKADICLKRADDIAPSRHIS